MLLQDYDVTTRYQAKVLRSDRITPEESKEEVREILLEVEKGHFDVEVGQNIGVLAPGRSEMGQDHHFRLYSVASVPSESNGEAPQLSIAVRRCSYIDEYSGEEYPGVASNYLCDLVPGDQLTISGPYGQAFDVPNDPEANLILIGAGTGIAPFRAFVKHLYASRPDFAGRVLLFHGAHTGLELLYRNQKRDDFALYYDKQTFDAINALSRRPGWTDQADWDEALLSKSEELQHLLRQSKTYVYVAGLQPILAELDRVFSRLAESPEAWGELKNQLVAEDRWIELIYG